MSTAPWTLVWRFVWTFVWTFGFVHNGLRCMARAVKAGAAEGATCGPWALRARRRTAHHGVGRPDPAGLDASLSRVLRARTDEMSVHGSSDLALELGSHRKCKCVTYADIRISHKIPASGICRVGGAGFVFQLRV